MTEVINFFSLATIFFTTFIMIESTTAIREKPGRLKPSTMVPIQPIMPTENPPPSIIDEHPVTVILQTQVQQESSSDEGEDKSHVQVGHAVHKTKTLTRVFHNYDKVSPTDELESVTLTASSCEDEEPTKSLTKKNKKKKKKKEKNDINVTETITDITNTLNETVNAVGANVVVELIRTVVSTKQFMVILVIGAIFVGIGSLLRIIYNK